MAYDQKVEQAIIARLYECEIEKQAAERKLEAARVIVMERDEAIAHWRFALGDYRKAHDLPVHTNYRSPVVAEEYALKTPTEFVYCWAEKHDGHVVVKDAAKAGIEAGIFMEYRIASSSIYSVAKRKNFTKLGPGHFQRPESALSLNGHHHA